MAWIRHKSATMTQLNMQNDTNSSSYRSESIEEILFRYLMRICVPYISAKKGIFSMVNASCMYHHPESP